MNRRLLGTALAFTLLFATAAVAADTPPGAQALIDAALAAHGGAPALKNWPSLELKGSLEASSRGSGRRSDITWRERNDGAYRHETTFERAGRKVTSAEFYDLHVVKRRFGQSWDDLPLDEAREVAAHRLPFLLTLKPEGAMVMGETLEADVACWRLSVPDGRDKTELFLAKEGGRVVAIDYPGTSADGMGTKKEVRRKVVFRDLRKVGDVLVPFDVEGFEDGAPDYRLRFDTITLLASFDGAWIRLPDPTRRYIPGEELSF